MTDKPTTASEYLASLTDAQRTTLARLRETISAAAPEAQEAFSYGMPAFTLGGRSLLWFAAWKHHYSMYPIGAAILEAQSADGEVYETSKGTLRFPASQQLPYDFVTRLVKARVAELQEHGK
jgi:uncharacterized protein YdhG (YjbR/CyaY superfamily)